MILAYRELCMGVSLEDCLGLIRYTIHIISYVDDNTLLRTFPMGFDMNQALRAMSHNFETWNKNNQCNFEGKDLIS